jgi:hypothetical protein
MVASGAYPVKSLAKGGTMAIGRGGGDAAAIRG